LTVERIDSLSRRPSMVFVTGVLEGEPLQIGDGVVIQEFDQTLAHTVVRSIEMHSAPGKTTIVLDVDLKPLVRPGVVISR
jgi:hypothetical protein